MEGFSQWWQYLPGQIDPYLFRVGEFGIGWYGLMYVAAFFTSYFVCVYRIRTEGFPYKKEYVQDFLVWVAFGLIIGARLGYVLFYGLEYYIYHPLEIILPFSSSGGSMVYTGISGMSYHGGGIGVFIASVWFFRRHGGGFFAFTDFFVPSIPAGYFFGRIGNFINGELYGRAAEGIPWAMYFPSDPMRLPRHPSQLYEAFGEGVLLFVILWVIRNQSWTRGVMIPIYLIGYGVVRFFLEYFREPDAHLGFILFSLSMGQVLCLAMVFFGVTMAWLVRSRVLSGNSG